MSTTYKKTTLHRMRYISVKGWTRFFLCCDDDDDDGAKHKTWCITNWKDVQWLGKIHLCLDWQIPNTRISFHHIYHPMYIYFTQFLINPLLCIHERNELVSYIILTHCCSIPLRLFIPIFITVIADSWKGRRWDFVGSVV